MHLHRFYKNLDLEKNNLEIQDKDFINQIKNVLKMEIGGSLVLFNGDGWETKYNIVSFEKNLIKLEKCDYYKNENEPEKSIILFCAILKRENFELVVQKATELGVKKIIPIITSRTVKLGLNLERLKKITIEASEQSGRATIPEINEPIDLSSAVKLAEKNYINIFLHTNLESNKTSLLSDQNFVSENDKTIGLFVGPEGGWDKNEVEMAIGAGFQLKSLGKLILRAETAVISAISKILN